LEFGRIIDKNRQEQHKE